MRLNRKWIWGAALLALLLAAAGLRSRNAIPAPKPAVQALEIAPVDLVTAEVEGRVETVAVRAGTRPAFSFSTPTSRTSHPSC